MKLWIKYLSFFLIGILLFIISIKSAKNPESTIEGQWVELIWEYEKVDINDSSTTNYKSISNYVKNIIGENLIIHKAESWKFYPNGRLILEGKKYTKEVSWCMKGRGNILEIKHDNQNTEHYYITELSADKMILNFDTDIHTRGIARLTFKKTK